MRLCPLLAVWVLAATIALPSQGADAGSCGPRPAEPEPEAGCNDLREQCVCDSSDQVCQWEWHCVLALSPTVPPGPERVRMRSGSISGSADITNTEGVSDLDVEQMGRDRAERLSPRR